MGRPRLEGLSSENSKTGQLQRACLKILREHESENALPTSIRFVYYELIQRGVIEKHRASGGRADTEVCQALTTLRGSCVCQWTAPVI